MGNVRTYFFFQFRDYGNNKTMLTIKHSKMRDTNVLYINAGPVSDFVFWKLCFSICVYKEQCILKYILLKASVILEE